MRQWRRRFDERPWLLREDGGLPIWVIATLSLIILNLVGFMLVHFVAARVGHH